MPTSRPCARSKPKVILETVRGCRGQRQHCCLLCHSATGVIHSRTCMQWYSSHHFCDQQLKERKVLKFLLVVGMQTHAATHHSAMLRVAKDLASRSHVNYIPPKLLRHGEHTITHTVHHQSLSLCRYSCVRFPNQVPGPRRGGMCHCCCLEVTVVPFEPNYPDSVM